MWHKLVLVLWVRVYLWIIATIVTPHSPEVQPHHKMQFIIISKPLGFMTQYQQNNKRVHINNELPNRWWYKDHWQVSLMNNRGTQHFFYCAFMSSVYFYIQRILLKYIRIISWKYFYFFSWAILDTSAIHQTNLSKFFSI